MSEMSKISASTSLSGAQKAAVLMLTLGEERVSSLFENLEESELRRLSKAMVELKDVPQNTVEVLIKEFSAQVALEIEALNSIDNNEPRLFNSLSAKKTVQITNPPQKSLEIWNVLNSIEADRLSRFLLNERPQTAAAVLSSLSAEQAARVVTLMPDKFASEVLDRILECAEIKPEVMHGLEQTLRMEFMHPNREVQEHTTRVKQRQMVAEILDNLGSKTKSSLLGALDRYDKTATNEVRKHMLKFEDLMTLSTRHMIGLMEKIELKTLVIALKGCDEETRIKLINNLQKKQRAQTRVLAENLGPIRLKDIDLAQEHILATARVLCGKSATVAPPEKPAAQILA